MLNVFRLLVITVLLCLLSGCGFKDIDKRFFVIVVGIDQGEKNFYKISLKLAIPSPRTEPGEAKFQVISQEADSIAEAVRRMKSKVDKEFDFGHCKIIVIGKSYANSRELEHSLDFFFRRRDIQQIAYMAIGEPDAQSIVAAKAKSERLPGNDLILAFTGQGTESPYIVAEPLFDYYRRYRDLGKDPYLPIIRSEGETLLIERLAVLQTDRKRLELSPEETSAFNQLARGYRRFIIKGSPEQPQLTFSATKMDVHYKILTPAGKDPVIRYRVNVEVEAEESPSHLFDKRWREMEKMAEVQLREQYRDLLVKFQKHGVDPIGFGIRYRATRHKGHSEYGEWMKNVYPNAAFDIRVHVKFNGTGVIK